MVETEAFLCIIPGSISAPQPDSGGISSCQWVKHV